MKLFLSYCHKDKEHLDAFRKHTAPLKQEGAITDWHDREIPVGEHIEQTIDAHLESADIIALFISAEFLASDSCRKEIEAALLLKKKNKAAIMPIIVSHCDWKNSKLSEFKACPTNGEAVEDWGTPAHAWGSVTTHLRDLLQSLTVTKKEPSKGLPKELPKELSTNFQEFLDNPGEFISSDQNNILTLQDIYVHPILKRTPRLDENDDIIRQESAKFLGNLDGGLPRTPVLILGDELSGKTALCRMLCRQYGNMGRVPVYINGSSLSNDNLDQIEKSAFEKQYQHLSSGSVSNDEKIILFDNFAGENLKRKDLLSLLSKMKERSYRAIILTADATNAFFISARWGEISVDHQITTYRIKPTGYKTRAKIVEKWVNKTQKADDKDARDRLIDSYREHIDAMSMGNSIPSHPFYILTMLENMAGASALHQPEMRADKTSYGHCYTALVTQAMLRAGVQPLKIGEYFNVLTELAYYIYRQGKVEINDSEFSAFIKKYEERYMEAPSMVLDTLLKSGALSRNLLCIRMQEYMFYYFTAKYLSQNFVNETEKEQCKLEIEAILSDAHRKRNGNILLFLVHHMPKSRYLLDRLNEDLDALLAGYPEATLHSEETEPLEEFLRELPKPCIDQFPSDSDMEKSRDHQVDKASKREAFDNQIHEEAEAEGADNTNGRELIRISKSFRMMRIAGSLLKNQYGTMEKQLLMALATRLRGLSFRIVRVLHTGITEDTEGVMSYIGYLMSKRQDWDSMPEHEREYEIRKRVGILTLESSFALIDRCALSIGSDKLVALINEIGEEQEDLSPAHQLLHLAASLWYGKKNLQMHDKQLKDIESMRDAWKNNLLATRLLKGIVASHLHMRNVDHKTRSHLAHSLELNVKGQLIGHQRHKT